MTLYTRYEKSIKTLFKGNSKRIAEFTKRLDDLRFVRAGNILIRAGDKDYPITIRRVVVSPGDVVANDVDQAVAARGVTKRARRKR